MDQGPCRGDISIFDISINVGRRSWRIDDRTKSKPKSAGNDLDRCCRWVTDREREKERVFRRRVSKAWSIGTRKCVFGVVYLRPTNPVAKWNAIIGSYVCVVTLLYSSRACCEITSDSRFINMVNEHRLPFAWTMFDPLIISLRTSNRFNGLTDRVTTRRDPCASRFVELYFPRKQTVEK